MRVIEIVGTHNIVILYIGSGRALYIMCTVTASVLDRTRCSHVIESFAHTRATHTRITIYMMSVRGSNRIRQQSVTHLFEIYTVYHIIILDTRAYNTIITTLR